MSRPDNKSRPGWLKSAFSRITTAVLTNDPGLKFSDAMISGDTNSLIHYAQKWRLPADLLGQGLVTAVKKGDAEAAKALIEAGADANHKGGQPLYFAVADGNAETVRVLLEKGADINAGGGRAYKAATRMKKKDVMAVIEEFSTHRLHAMASLRRKSHAATRS